MSSFVLKIIAVITMFVDHIGYVIYGHFSCLNYIGRIAFPIFAFQLSEGYIHTKNLKNYFIRLLSFAVISQIPFMLFLSIFNKNFVLNIFFTLFLGLAAISLYDKMKYKIVGLAFVAFIAYIAEMIHVDYGYWGVLVIFFFYFFRENKVLMAVSFIILVIAKYIPIVSTPQMLSLLFTVLPIIPILLYNQKQGKKTKYFLYIFYPSHLLLFYFLNFIL